MKIKIKGKLTTYICDKDNCNETFNSEQKQIEHTIHCEPPAYVSGGW